MSLDEEEHVRSRKTKKTDIQHLSYEILLDIFSRLPIQDLSHCRFLSKYCYKTLSQILKDPFFIQLRNSRKTHEEDSNYLVICRKSNDLSKLYLADLTSLKADTADRTSLKITNINIELPGQIEIVGSSNGLICLVSLVSLVSLADYKNFYLCNPITGETSMFPDAPSIDNTVLGENNEFCRFNLCGFAFDSSTNNYKIVGSWSYLNNVSGNHCMAMDICTYGSTIWSTRVGHIDNCIFAPCKNATCVILKGAFHWRAFYYEFRQLKTCIVAMGIGDESLKRMNVPLKSEPFPQLFSFEGCLSLLVEHESEIRVWIMEDYDVQNSWKKRYLFQIDSPQSSVSLFINMSHDNILTNMNRDTLLEIVKKLSDEAVFVR